jgi:hypothetical protein
MGAQMGHPASGFWLILGQIAACSTLLFAVFGQTETNAPPAALVLLRYVLTEQKRPVMFGPD